MTSNNNNNNNYESVHVTLRMHSSLARLLKIFANIHGEGSTEYKSINNFVTEEIVQTVKALAADPLPEEYPDSFKQLVQRLLKESETTEETITK